MKTSLKTLVIRFSSIGDIVLSTPLLRVLRGRFPDGQIDFLTKKEYADLVRFNQNLNVTHAYDTSTGFEGLRRMKKKLRDERYDLIVDIHNSMRSRFVRSIRGVKDVVTVDKRYLERTALVKFKKNLYKNSVPVSERYIETVYPYGIKNDGKGPELHIPDEVLFSVSGKIASLRLNRFESVLGICPGAKHATKRWIPERFAALAVRHIKEKDGAVVLFGGREDQELCRMIGDAIASDAGKERVIDFCGGFSLLESAAAMEFCDIIVSNDTGLMHIATAMKKKTVAIFGSTVKQFGFFPQAENSVVIERTGLRCRPCSHIGLQSCPEKHFRCMNDTGVDEVYEKVNVLLSKT